MRKLLTASALGLASVAVFGLGTIAVTVTQAHETDDGDTFIEQLAQKLGISSDQVEEAVDEIREEHKLERQTQFNMAVEEALASGELTQRQVDIIQAQADLRETHEFERPDRSDLEGMTVEERHEYFEEMHSERMQQMIDSLNSEYNLDVSQDELEELRETMRDLEISDGFRRMGHHRGGTGFGRF